MLNCDLLEHISYRDEIALIVGSALNAVDPVGCVKENVQMETNQLRIGNRSFSLTQKDKVLICGFGKASQLMALGLQKSIPELITGGCIITKHIDDKIAEELIPRLQTLQGGHPIPDKTSMDSTNILLDKIRPNMNDLVICLISGGGSALFTKPHQRVEIEKFRELTKELILCGADIQEINTIRKHIDLVKGGRFLRFLSPGRVVSLILSDVVGDDVSNIASGPTAADSSTFMDTINILHKYAINFEKHKEIIQFLCDGKNGKEEETVKPGDPLLLNCDNLIIGSNTIAAQAARLAAQSLGYETCILTNEISGESRIAAKTVAHHFFQWAEEKNPDNPLCMIVGGETTVKVTGPGKGGRNQEFITALSRELIGRKNLCAMSIATDGEDGPTDAAGGLVTGETEHFAMQKGLNSEKALMENDTYPYLKELGCLLTTGPTGTNVNDLIFIFQHKN